MATATATTAEAQHTRYTHLLTAADELTHGDEIIAEWARTLPFDIADGRTEDAASAIRNVSALLLSLALESPRGERAAAMPHLAAAEAI